MDLSSALFVQSRRREEKMERKPKAVAAVLPKWVLAWLIVDIFIILWDSSFVLLRPASLPGGKLGHFWTLPNGFGYATYIRADRMYGDVNNAWSWAQSIGNMLEISFQLYAILLAFRRCRSAVFWTFAVSLCTFFKTVLYFLVCLANPAAVWTSDLSLWLSAFLLPNSFWLAIPLAVLFSTGKTIVRSLNTGTKKEKKEL